MEYKYNKIRYLELLKEAETLKKKGMSLYKEDENRYRELLNYEVQLSDQKSWKKRETYFSLMNSFSKGKITAEDFMDEFLGLWQKDQDTFEIDCEPNIRSKGFGRWMDKVFSRCEVFEPEAEQNEQYGEKWLKDSVSNLLIQMQKEYNSN